MGAGPLPVSPVGPGLASPVERLRRVHRLMVDAALRGDDLERARSRTGWNATQPAVVLRGSRAMWAMKLPRGGVPSGSCAFALPSVPAATR
jgi:hypothetical protein